MPLGEESMGLGSTGRESIQQGLSARRSVGQGLNGWGWMGWKSMGLGCVSQWLVDHGLVWRRVAMDQGSMDSRQCWDGGGGASLPR